MLYYLKNKIKKICLLLPGDTAQSIMRGIAFRFSDLRSLFYHAKQSMQAMGKTSAIEVPKQVGGTVTGILKFLADLHTIKADLIYLVL